MSIGITGLAVKCCIGSNADEFYDALCQHKDGNAPLKSFDANKFNSQHAYEIDDRVDGEDRPYRASEWLQQAIEAAIEQSNIDLSGKRCAIFVGTGLRELRSVELWHNKKVPVTLDRLHFAKAVTENLPKDIPVYTFCNACSASNFALGMAKDMIESGELDCAIAAGTDSITESMFGLLDRVNPMNPQVLRSFNQDRRGVIMGEGAAAVVLEKDPTSKPQAWLKGVGFSCDAYQDTAPEENGLVRAMNDASKCSGVSANEIDALFVHGTGTILNDEVELAATGQYFADRTRDLYVTGVKPNIGHTSGASGLISVITAIKSMQNNQVPPIFGLSDPIEGAPQIKLLAENLPAESVNNVQVNAFGFGGVNAVAVVSRS
ncbi:beta-ketoacyl synthase N-terminal-like domain-containing protein [Aliikangiella maris]|uniref:Beta-ketoacyl synthase N-terminal-like domain-containing protein n=2 Tax=Aliikangiella maris TaxID=3162458 RepID=A0ABV2BUX8_9GAMM